MKNVSVKEAFLSDFLTNEAFKELRTNIQFCGNHVKKIIITSSVPNEGKSYIAYHLSLSIAEAGKKVLLLDCDLRNSLLISQFQISDEIDGLSHYLSGLSDYEDILCKTNIDNLHVIFSGHVPPNPTELLDNDSFKNLITDLSPAYDYIIMDTPPLGGIIDSALVAKNCDGAIMVISSNKISYKYAKKTKELLLKSNCKILGAVLNKVNRNKNKIYKKYYNAYYKKGKNY